MPIDAFLFGGRRSTVVPLVHEALDWEHGVFLGSMMGSETTAAAAGAVGKLRRDPFAMLPFCGYHMADYFAHWLRIGEREGAKLPKVFYVNWFRKDPEDGHFLWPGFGENARVLEWVFRRCDGEADAADTPIGLVPTPEALDTDGLDLAARRPRAAAAASTRRSGSRRSSRSASSTRSSATSCRPSWRASSTRSSSGSDARDDAPAAGARRARSGRGRAACARYMAASASRSECAAVIVRRPRTATPRLASSRTRRSERDALVGAAQPLVEEASPRVGREHARRRDVRRAIVGTAQAVRDRARRVSRGMPTGARTRRRR